MKKQLITILFISVSLMGFSQSEITNNKLEEAKKIDAYLQTTSLSQPELLYKIDKGWEILNDVKSAPEAQSINTLSHIKTGISLTDEILLSNDFNILMYNISFDNKLSRIFSLENGTQSLVVWSEERIKILHNRIETNKKQNK